MRVDALDFDLPEELIAQQPLANREESRMLVVHRESGQIEHMRFLDLPSYLRAGDLIVMNDTRVTAVRLRGRRATGAAVELLLLRELAPGAFMALAKPAKKLRPGERVQLDGGLVAVVQADYDAGQKLVRLEDPAGSPASPGSTGETPLPPYIRASLSDPERYQTVYAKTKGSAAAPTAGLHFTQEMLSSLTSMGVDRAFVTLDVSLDTFRPIQTETVEEHTMHGETCRVSPDTADQVARCSGRVIAVGTTTVRTLESLAQGPRVVRAGESTTSLFLVPGSRLQVVDGLLTNFHMPRTTMLLMVAAFIGVDALRAAYAEAVRERYRFLSFGDCMLVI